MLLSETKTNIHTWVDKTNNEELLHACYQFIMYWQNKEEKTSKSKLSENDLNELLLSYSESFNEDNLIANDTVKQKFATWFTK